MNRSTAEQFQAFGVDLTKDALLTLRIFPGFYSMFTAAQLKNNSICDTL